MSDKPFSTRLGVLPRAEPETDKPFAAGCVNCRFVRTKGSGLQCRLKAPLSQSMPMPDKTRPNGVGISTYTWWPTVDPGDWCGEYQIQIGLAEKVGH